MPWTVSQAKPGAGTAHLAEEKAEYLVLFFVSRHRFISAKGCQDAWRQGKGTRDALAGDLFRGDADA